MWLGAGAITLGIGAATLTSGTGVAHAGTDDSDGSAGTSQNADPGTVGTSSTEKAGPAKKTSKAARPKSDADDNSAQPAKTKPPKDIADKQSERKAAKGKPTKDADGTAPTDAPDGDNAAKVSKAEKFSKPKHAKEDPAGSEPAKPDASTTTDSVAVADTPTAKTSEELQPTAVVHLSSNAPSVAAAAATTNSVAGDQLAAALNAFLKQLKSALFNSTPTATVTGPEDAGDGTFAGQVIGADGDDDALTYAVLTAAGKGTAAVDGTGHYTYTPGADILATGGTDSFTIQVAEVNADGHIHGIGEILAWGYSKIENSPFGDPTSFSRVNKIITVTIAAPAEVTTDAVTAALASTAKATGPQAKAVAAVADPADQWAAALAAFLKSIQTKLFNKTPTATATGPADAGDGTYIGQIVGDDADDDPLTYTRNVNPTHGTITVDASGNYTYTPDADILATGGTDSFTIEVIESNAGTHIHGFGELLARAFYPNENFPNPASFSRALQKVTVTISAPSDDSNGSLTVTVSLPEPNDPTTFV